MTSLGRNQPCPCGSGKKFKNCHGREGNVNRGGLSLMDGGAAGNRPGAAHGDVPSPDPEARWEVDLFPAPIAIQTAPNARIASLMVMADGYVLFSDFHTNPPSEPGDVARVLMGGVERAAERVGLWPHTLAVRSEVIALELRTLLVERETSVTATRLPEVDDAGRSLMAHLNPGSPERPLGLSIPETWGSWGLPAELVGELFAASAGFFRDRPWERLANADLLAAECPTGTSWTAVVLGEAGMEFGLALYADRTDIERQLSTASPDPGWEDVVLSLTFARRNDLPPAMRKEILAAGWEVASTDAWPLLITVNTPGGGISRAQATDLRDLLRALPEFSRLLESARAEGASSPFVRHDPETGVALVLESDDEEDPLLWAPPSSLEPALPMGSGAHPELALLVQNQAKLSREAEDLVDRFQESLSTRFSAKTAFRHADNAELFLTYLSDVPGIPVEAMTEYDLVSFLFDWVHRTVIYPRGEMRAIPVSLKRFFHFLEVERELLLPWAWDILDDREAFDLRAESYPGGFALLSPDLQEWIGDLGPDLGARVFLPNPAMADGGFWGPMMGEEEATLFHELSRRWLIWRDEVIASGVTAPGEVREELATRQASWERSPHPAYKGKTPLQVVRRERKSSGDRW